MNQAEAKEKDILHECEVHQLSNEVKEGVTHS